MKQIKIQVNQTNPEQESMVLSPLTASKNVALVETLQADKLIVDWKSYLQIDITDELHGCKKIYLCKCNQTELGFFMPSDIAGSSKLYEQLEKFDWYYMSEKWEYDVAMQDLKGCQNIIEVGAGRGAFVERLCKGGLNAQGIELNLNAVRYAEERNIPVQSLDLHEAANNQEGFFDAVCSFQVLEHVPDPKDFLLSLVKLLKKEGKLIVSVPNSKSFPKHYQKNLLDQPPHHMTQWCSETFRSLTSLLPVRVERFRIEPLASYHVDWYIEIQESRLPEPHSLRKPISLILHRILKPLLHRYSWIRSLIPGHTLYVYFKKTH